MENKIHKLMEVATKLYDVQPWMFIEEPWIINLTINNKEYYVNFFGGDSVQHGLLINFGVEGFNNLLCQLYESELGYSPIFVINFLDYFFVSFKEEKDLSLDEYEFYEKYHLNFDRNIYPIFSHKMPSKQIINMEEEYVDIMIDLLNGLIDATEKILVTPIPNDLIEEKQIIKYQDYQIKFVDYPSYDYKEDIPEVSMIISSYEIDELHPKIFEDDIWEIDFEYSTDLIVDDLIACLGICVDAKSNYIIQVTQKEKNIDYYLSAVELFLSSIEQSKGVAKTIKVRKYFLKNFLEEVFEHLNLNFILTSDLESFDFAYENFCEYLENKKRSN